jgi:hypothetical protein
MTTGFQLIGRQTLTAPLGLRFRDAATGAAVAQGLRVTLYPTANPSRRAQAFANPSGIYVAHSVGLRASEMGAGDEAFWAAPPASAPYTVEVVDDERRYLPYSFPLTLPSKGISTWTWPLAEATSRQSAEPAASLADDFDDGVRGAPWKLGTLNVPASVFDSNVAIAEQGGRLEITPLADAAGSHFNGYVSIAGWNLTDARASVEVAQVAAGAAQTLFTLASDANNWLRFVIEAGRLKFQSRAGGMESSPDVAYDAAQQRLLRLRHDARADRVLFETSADGDAWVERRSLATPFPITSLLVELGAGTTGKVAAPGAAVFENFRMEANPSEALPLFSAPTRIAAAGLATLRASLWDAAADEPAAWAMLEARIAGRPTVRGLADEAGRVALVFPYPEPASFAEQSPPPASAPFTKQEWPVQLFASYAPRRPVPPLAALPDALGQPRAKLWADAALTSTLTQATLRAGRELVVRSFETSPEAPSGARPLPVLLITPAGSPP